MHKDLLSYKNIFLGLYILFCCLGLWIVFKENILLDIVFKVVRFSFLIAFYVVCSKQLNKKLLVSIILFLVCSIFYSIDYSHILGIILLGFSRIPLVSLLLEDMKKNYLKTFKIVALLFLGFLSMVLWLMYKNTFFYYTSIFPSVLLVLLISLSFSVLAGANKKRNLFMFFGIALFLISDAIFGAQKINEAQLMNIFLSHIFYSVGYYFVTVSVIRKDNFYT